MPGNLQTEIRQTKPFASLEEEAYLALQLTADRISRRGAEFLNSSRVPGECSAGNKDLGPRKLQSKPVDKFHTCQNLADRNCMQPDRAGTCLSKRAVQEPESLL